MSAKPIDIEILGREFTVSCTDEEREGLLACCELP
jgi:cell division protein ZapA (FtsZ GTPase activity inhibitor)